MSCRIERDSLDRYSSVIRLAGDVDLYDAPELKDLMAESIRAGTRHLICDLSEVTFIDSTALGVMIQARKRLEPDGGSIRVACPGPAIADIFEAVGLDRMVPVHASLDDAIAAVRIYRGPVDGPIAKRSGVKRWLASVGRSPTKGRYAGG